jgi:hypothetical protein
MAVKVSGDAARQSAMMLDGEMAPVPRKLRQPKPPKGAKKVKPAPFPGKRVIKSASPASASARASAGTTATAEPTSAFSARTASKRKSQVLRNGQKVGVEGYIRPFGIIASHARKPYVAVAVRNKKGPVIHWLQSSRLTPCNEGGAWEKLLRDYLKSPEGKRAASGNSGRSGGARQRPSKNTPARGLPGFRRGAVRLIS